MSTPPSLASGPEGPPALRPLLDTVLDALTEGARARGGPLPSGGPEAVAARLRAAVGDVLPDRGDPNALHHLVRALAEGAADPADPLCTAHLHCPPLALATAADLAASALNPSLDSWDQAPGAAELEALVTDTLAREVFTPTPQPGALLDPSAPRGTATAPHEGPAPDTPASGVAAAMEACSLSDAAAPRAAADASQAGRPSDAPASGVAAAMEACSLSDAAAPRAAADASQAGRPSDAPASGVAAAMEACSLSDAAAPRAAADASQAGRPSDAPASGVAAAMEACSLPDAAAPRAAADASQAGRPSDAPASAVAAAAPWAAPLPDAAALRFAAVAAQVGPLPDASAPGAAAPQAGTARDAPASAVAAAAPWAAPPPDAATPRAAAPQDRPGIATPVLHAAPRSPRPAAPRSPRPAALVTTGGTESNQLALLLAREAHGGGVRLVHGSNAHHSLPRAAWLLGMPEPVVVPAPAGTLDPVALDEALTRLAGPPGSLLVAATAGSTDAGLIDPLQDIAARCAAHGARLHIDAAYGGGLLFSDRYRDRLTGLHAADTVALDLHKFGWQPVAAGLLAVRDPRDLTVLHRRADYLNAEDDTEAGLPDLLGRSLRTSRRPDALKIAVTLRTLGRHGLGRLVEHVCDTAHTFAALVHRHPGFELLDPPTISTVLFRPAHTTDDAVAAVRRKLLTDGRAVLGRARLDGRLWLKATFLNPRTRPDDLAALLKLVEGNTPG